MRSHAEVVVGRRCPPRAGIIITIYFEDPAACSVRIKRRAPASGHAPRVGGGKQDDEERGRMNMSQKTLSTGDKSKAITHINAWV